MRVLCADQRADVGPFGGVNRGIADRVQVAHVRARAEGAAAAGHDDDADAGIGLRVIETCVERAGQTAAPAVHPLGPIEGQHRDTGVADVVENRGRIGFDGVRNAHPVDLLITRPTLGVWTYCTPIGSVFRSWST